MHLQRVAMFSQSVAISIKLLKELKVQMQKDKTLLMQNTFKTDNTYQNFDKNMDGLTYFPIYTKFISAKFDDIWKHKGAHKAHWKGPSLERYTIKMKRFVMMDCYNLLQKEKKSHLSM